jgi:integrase
MMIRQRAKDTFEIRIECARDPLTGTRSIGYHTFKGTKRQAQAEERRLLAQRDLNQYAKPSQMTVDEWVCKWLHEYRNPQLTIRTLQGYEDIVRLHISPVLGHRRLDQVTAPHVQALVTNKLNHGRTDGKGGLSGQSVIHIFRLVNEIFASAVALGLLPANPCRAIKVPVVKRTEARALSTDEVAILIAAVKDTRFYSPVIIALGTALRRGELLALTWNATDLDKGAIQVVQALSETRAGVHCKEPKTVKSRRSIVLPASVLAELKEHQRKQHEKRLLLGPGYSDHDLVFPSKDGTPWKPSLFSGAFRDLVQKAGIKGCCFHTLRHTSISYLLMQNVPVKVVSARAGHSSLAITADLYGHVLQGADEKAAQALDGLCHETARTAD